MKLTANHTNHTNIWTGTSPVMEMDSVRVVRMVRGSCTETGNGNITYMVNSSRTLAASYRYDAFGNLLSSSGSLAGANKYRFSSKEWVEIDPWTQSIPGIYYYGYRFYVPSLQRWPNRDPLGEKGFRQLIKFKRIPIDNGNLYEFVRNSAVNQIDSLGLFLDSLTGYYRSCAEMHVLGEDAFCDCLCASVTTGAEDHKACVDNCKNCSGILAGVAKKKASLYDMCLCLCQAKNKQKIKNGAKEEDCVDCQEHCKFLESND